MYPKKKSLSLKQSDHQRRSNIVPEYLTYAYTKANYCLVLVTQSYTCKVNFNRIKTGSTSIFKKENQCFRHWCCCIPAIRRLMRPPIIVMQIFLFTFDTVQQYTFECSWSLPKSLGIEMLHSRWNWKYLTQLGSRRCPLHINSPKR